MVGWVQVQCTSWPAAPQPPACGKTERCCFWPAASTTPTQQVSPWNSLAALLSGGAGSQLHQQLQGGTSDGTGAAAVLLRLLLAVTFGHAALHVYYIATWHRQHARNVVKMSAVPDMRSR